MFSDNCCSRCKGPHGICRTRGQCSHHIAVRRRQDADDSGPRFYRNPTQDQAIANVMRQNRNPFRAAAKRPFSYPEPRSKK